MEILFFLTGNLRYIKHQLHALGREYIKERVLALTLLIAQTLVAIMMVMK